MILDFLRRGASGDAADALYRSAVEAARNADFYGRYGVADTVEGRFEMVMLHAGLIVSDLKERSPAGARLARRVSEVFFADMDRNLREMGVGDLSVGKRMQKIAAAFYGRSDAYRAGLADAMGEGLTQALDRNVYSGEGGVAAAALAPYVRMMAGHIAETPEADLLGGRVVFPAPSLLQEGAA
jgi:cytochrome b pre-mRNA-processing protein 3